jgi:hypothetical protein
VGLGIPAERDELADVEVAVLGEAFAVLEVTRLFDVVSEALKTVVGSELLAELATPLFVAELDATLEAEVRLLDCGLVAEEVDGTALLTGTGWRLGLLAPGEPPALFSVWAVVVFVKDKTPDM